MAMPLRTICPMDITGSLRLDGGAARTGRLLQGGFSKRQIAAAVRDGAVRRPARGIIALPEAPEDMVRALCANARITCISAGGYYGLWVLHKPERLHLSAPHSRLPPDCVDHRSPGTGGPAAPVSALPQVLCHALHCLPPLEALVMVECAVGRGDIDLAFLRGLLAGPRNGRARRVLDLVEPGADSLIETIARVLFRGQGIHVETQVRIEGVGWVDLLLEGFLIIELDGRDHLDRRQFKKDRRRDNMSVAGGYLVLRYLYEDVVFHSEEMLQQVWQVLRGRRRLPR